MPWTRQGEAASSSGALPEVVRCQSAGSFPTDPEHRKSMRTRKNTERRYLRAAHRLRKGARRLCCEMASCFRVLWGAWVTQSFQTLATSRVAPSPAETWSGETWSAKEWTARRTPEHRRTSARTPSIHQYVRACRFELTLREGPEFRSKPPPERSLAAARESGVERFVETDFFETDLQTESSETEG